METVGQAALDIIPNIPSDFDRRLDRGTSGALIAAGGSGGRRYGDAAGKSMTSSFLSHAKRAALLGAGVITVAAAGIFKLGKDSIAEARESQKVGALTTQVIKSTGAAAGVTAREVGNLSTALSLKTGVDDEVIQRGANMLLTFKNIRNEVGKNNDIFDQSVAITEDMAAAMAGGQGGNNLDLKSSSILVGKALNDPVKGLTALTRVGVSFTDQQKKNIETLVEQNKQSDAQKVILKELQSEFGGAAASQATLGEKVSVAWGNIEEKLGTALLPLINDVERAFLRKGVPAAERFSDWFRKDGAPAIRGFVDDAKPFVHELLPAAASVLGTVRDTAHDALPFVKSIVETFNDMPDWVKKGVALGGLGLLAGKKLGVGGLLGGAPGGGGVLSGIASKANPVPVWVVNEGFGDPDAGWKKKAPWLAAPAATAAIAVGSGAATYKGLDIIRQGMGQDAAYGAAGAPLGASHGGFGGSYVSSALADDPSNSLANTFPDIVSKDYAKPFALGAKSAAEFDSALQNLSHQKGPEAASQAFFDFADNIGIGREELREIAPQFAGMMDTWRDGTTSAGGKAKWLSQLIGGPLAGSIDTASGKARNLGTTLDGVSGPHRGSVTVDTGDSEARLNRILTLMNTISHRGGLQASGALPGGRNPEPAQRPSTGAAGRTSSRGGPRGRAGTPINIHIGGDRVATVIDNRIGTYDELTAERQRAGVAQ